MLKLFNNSALNFPLLWVIFSFFLLLGNVWFVSLALPNGLIAYRYFVFFACLGCLGLLLGILMLKNKSLEFMYEQTDILLLIYLLYSIVSFWYFGTNYSEAVLAWFLLLGMYWVLRWIFALMTCQLVIIIFLSTFMLMASGQAVYGLLQLYGYLPSFNAYHRVTGSFHNPGPFGIYLATVFPLALGVYLFRKLVNFLDWFLYYQSILTMALIVLILPATQSRTALLAWFGSVVCLISVKYNLWSRLKAWFDTKPKKILGLGVLLFLLIVSAYFIYQWRADSVLGRVLVWEVSTLMFQVNPFFGLGLGSFERFYLDYQAQYFEQHGTDTPHSQLADKVIYAFNDYLQIVVEQGLVGLFLWFSVLFSVIFKTFKSMSGLSDEIKFFHLSSMTALSVILFSALFSYPFEVLPLQVHFWVLLVGLSIKQTTTEDLIILKPIIRLSAAVTIIFSGFWFLHWQHKIYEAKKQWQTTNELYDYQHYGQAIENYKILYPTLSYEGEFLLSYGKALYQAKLYERSIEILEKAKSKIADPFLYINLGNTYQKTKNYDKAEAAYQYATLMIPNRMYPHYLLAKMYLEQGDTIKAIQRAKLILKMPVKVASSATREMKNEMKTFLEEEKERVIAPLLDDVQ